jgi:hypothetical protein
MKVVPKNDSIRNLIKHPVAGAFRTEGSSDWPDDTFTARRIADGDITVEEEPPPEGEPSMAETVHGTAEEMPAEDKHEQKPAEDKHERRPRSRAE